MLRGDGVAIHFFTAKFPVEGMQVQPVFPGNQRISLLQVRAQFIWRAGLARVIPRGHQSATQRAAKVFKSAHVIALPAMEGNGNAGQRFQGDVHVHSEAGIALPGEFKSW